METYKFILPPNQEPINYNPYNDLYQSLFAMKDNQKLIEQREKIMEEMMKNLKIRNKCYILSRGTKLYYASNYPEFNLKKDKLLFFSIDAELAIWNTLHKYIKKIDDVKNRYQYIHEIKLKKSICVEHIIKNIITNPRHILKSKKMVCIHPQAIIRGIPEDSIFFNKTGIFYKKGEDKIQLSMEIILPYDKIAQKFRFKKTYVIDPQELYKNKNDFNYDITKAIVNISVDDAKKESIYFKDFKKIFFS